MLFLERLLHSLKTLKNYSRKNPLAKIIDHIFMECRSLSFCLSVCLFFFFQELGISITHSNVEVVGGSDVVFVAVKPHLIPLVLNEISPHVTDRHIVVSVAAGVTLATLEEVNVPATLKTSQFISNLLIFFSCPI